MHPPDRELQPNRVILFAKAPDPGRVKTRLIPALSPDSAAALHRAFVQDCLESLARFTPELHTDRKGWIGFPRVRLQSEGDLGTRMHHAASTALEEGAATVCILGTDAPTLPAGHVEHLLRSPADVTLGPAEDGGYWGICFRRAHPEMFAGVEWSSEHTLAQTVDAIHAVGLTTALGPQWWDVDEPRDLERLLSLAELPPHTARWKESTTALRRANSIAAPEPPSSR